MPRHRRAFIERSSARTYEVVYRPLRDGSGSERVFRVVERGNASGPVETGDDNLEYQPETAEQLPYERSTFELGEYGFVDDGYDYSKHFKKIGGKGGVFIPAATTKPNKPVVPEAFELRDGDAEVEDEVAPPVASAEDIRQRAEAIEEIQKDRKVNPMLDEVFALLDSDGELDGQGESEVEAPEAGDDMEEGVVDDAEEFPDDFVGLASGKDANAPETVADYDTALGKKEPVARPQRVLDDQFDQLMKAYEAEDEESELEDDDADRSRLNVDNLSDTDADSDGELEVETDLNDADLQALLGIEGLTLEKADDAPTDGVATMSTRGDNREEFRPEEHAELQLDSAMDKLMDSYKRVRAEDALTAIDGLAVARRAIADAEVAERARLEQQGDDAASSSNDEELDAMVSSAGDDRDRWDCETIVSTYSNLDNHPSVIDDGNGTRRRRRALPKVIRLDPRTQLPVDGVPAAAPSAGYDDRDFGTRSAKGAATEKRNKGETKEEKRKRKEAVKEAKRAGRLRKSEMKKAFAEEALAQNKHAVSLGKSKVAVQL